MKIQELHLKAFGAFTDRTLDLSGGREGLHLIHGPNEAGKSTALRAITQLLYGIETRTTDDFVHPMQHLRIGATLSNGQDTLAFYRRKGNKNTLLGADEKAKLADDALAPFLGGVDEAAFVNFFGLSHAQLVRGGEGLVQGEGDVGQALFSAAAGMGNLRDLLSRLEEEAGELFNPRASKPRINAALAQLKELRKAIKEVQLSSREWEALDSEWREAEARRATLDAELQDARAGEARLKRIQRALPLVSQRAALLEQLAPVADAPRLPADFTDRRHACRTEALNARTTRDAAAKALTAHEKALEAITVDEAVLANEDAIEELNERRAQNQKALADRDSELAPALQRVETEAERALHQLRPHWTLDQVEDLRLAPGQPQRIHELSRQGEGLKAQQAAAEADLLKRRRERARADEALEALGPAVDTAAVERALKQAIQAGNAEADLAARDREAGALEQSIEAGIARLGLWSGDRDALEALPVPAPSTIERFRVDLGDAAAQCKACEDRVAALEAELRDAEARWTAYQKEHDAPSLEALETIRHTRQEGWKQARAAWEAGTPPADVRDSAARAWLAAVRESHPDAENLADAYAALVESADVAADRLRNEADRVAARAQLESNVEALRADLDEAREAQRAQAAARAALEEAWTSTWEPAGITPRSPREMAEWKAAHAALLDEIKGLREARVAAVTLDETLATCRARLAGALREAGVPDAPETEALAEGIARAEAWVRRQRETRERRGQYEARRAALDNEELPAAEEALNAAEGELDTWRDEWAVVAEGLGAPASASSSEVLALVDAINALLAKAAEAEELRGRIDRIQRDDEAFRAEVRALAETVGHDAAGADEAAQVQALYAGLKQSRAAHQERDRLRQLRDAEAARCRETDAALARVDAEWKALCEEAGIDDPEALPEAEKASAERGRLEAKLEDVEHQLAGISAGEGLDALLEMAAGEDPDAIGPALEALGTQVEDLDDERLALREQIGRLEERLGQMDGSDKAAALEEEAQTLLAGMADDAEAYARLRVAAHVLRAAIERYREANQEPLLARAGEIFQRLTLRSFTGLRADVNEKDEHVLHGVRPDDSTLVPVGGMSEGTADQLYLALRLASLERHLENHPPLPFILDDILVNFDDDRAAAALEVLAEVSKRTQVVYFTHHQHLVDLAKECVDKKQLFVQSLSG